MAPPSRRKGARLIDRLADAPREFDFFQAVHLLECYAWENSHGRQSRRVVGGDARPAQEVVRFRVSPNLNFPLASIERISNIDNPEGREQHRLPVIEVNFMGLIGPNGVLPDHYTTLVLQRSYWKDVALREFLDLFHHRILSFFYRAKTKYHVPLSYARDRLSKNEGGGSVHDAYTDCLYSLIGWNTGGLRDRLSLPDETLLRHVSLFARKVRPAAGLAGLLSDYFNVTVQVEQFHGGWLYLHDNDMARLPSRNENQGFRLNVDFVIGRRVYDRQSRFLLKIGPLSYDRFKQFLPIGKYNQKLSELTRLYAGSELGFDVQPVLKADQVPEFRLTADEANGSRLGWNSWVFSQQPQTDRGDVVFSLDDAKAPA